MSEIQTPPQEQISTPDDFDDAIEMQNAAQRIVNPQPEATVWDISEPAKPNHTVRNRIIATGAGVALAAGAGAVAVEAMQPATFSEESTTYTVQDGDGLYNAAETIPGIESIDIRDAVDHISVDPANIDVLKDGLQAGEQLTIPVAIDGVEPTNE